MKKGSFSVDEPLPTAEQLHTRDLPPARKALAAYLVERGVNTDRMPDRADAIEGDGYLQVTGTIGSDYTIETERHPWPDTVDWDEMHPLLIAYLYEKGWL